MYRGNNGQDKRCPLHWEIPTIKHSNISLSKPFIEHLEGGGGVIMLVLIYFNFQPGNWYSFLQNANNNSNL